MEDAYEAQWPSNHSGNRPVPAPTQAMKRLRLSWTRRVLPRPGSPTMNKTEPAPDVVARITSSSTASSLSRPTKAAAPARRPRPR